VARFTAADDFQRLESSVGFRGVELSLLMALPDKQRSLVPDGQPVVTEIAVTEIAPSGIQAEEGQQ
jgi:hypothetical protein